MNQPDSSRKLYFLLGSLDNSHLGCLDRSYLAGSDRSHLAGSDRSELGGSDRSELVRLDHYTIYNPAPRPICSLHLITYDICGND